MGGGFPFSFPFLHCNGLRRLNFPTWRWYNCGGGIPLEVWRDSQNADSWVQSLCAAMRVYTERTLIFLCLFSCPHGSSIKPDTCWLENEWTSPRPSTFPNKSYELGFSLRWLLPNRTVAILCYSIRVPHIPSHSLSNQFSWLFSPLVLSS